MELKRIFPLTIFFMQLVGVLPVFAKHCGPIDPVLQKSCKPVTFVQLPVDVQKLMKEQGCDVKAKSNYDEGTSVDLNGDGTPEYIFCCYESPHGPCSAQIYGSRDGKWKNISGTGSYSGFDDTCSGFQIQQNQSVGYHDLCQEYHLNDYNQFAGSSYAMVRQGPLGSVFVQNGKGAFLISPQAKPQSALTDQLEENILAVQTDLAWVKAHPTAGDVYQKPVFKTTLIGKWNSYEVWEVNDEANQTYNTVIQLSPKDFRLIDSLHPVVRTKTLVPAKTVVEGMGIKSQLYKKIEIGKGETYEHRIFFDENSVMNVIDLSGR